MRKRLDFGDILLALALAAGAAYLLLRDFSPHPHPLHAPFLSFAAAFVSTKFCLYAGVCLTAALGSLIYLSLRYLRPWDKSDPPRAEVVSRLLSFGTALAIILWPQLYRLGTVLNCEFLTLFIGLIGFICWHGGRWGRNNPQYSIGVFLCSLIAALDLRALALLVVEMTCDAFARRNSSREELFDDEKESAASLRLRELICSLIALALGLPLSVFLRLRFGAALPPLASCITSPVTVIIAVTIGLVLAARTVSQKRRRYYGYRLGASSVLAVLALLLLDGGLVLRLEKMAPERKLLTDLGEIDSPHEFLRDYDAYRAAKRKWDLLFEDRDRALESVCDHELWRMARAADARGDKDLALTLDRANRTLQARGIRAFEEK